MLVLLMGEMYELCRSDGLRSHDIDTEYHEDWFSHSNVNKGDTHTDTQTHRQQGDLISLFLFLQNKESMIKTEPTLGKTSKYESS
jgi:hypothetical protein